MWMLLLKLLVSIASYFWDIGVDILMGKEQFGRLISAAIGRLNANSTTLNANSTTLDRLEYVVSSRIFDDNEFLAIHLYGTWSWIFAGCFFQFVIVICQIRHQSYLSTPWKFVIVLSSALLLGPTMIYFFCVCLILSFKLRLPSAPSTEQQIIDKVNRALLFASLSKLGEIFFESIPQILTQLLMTSANGNDGVRELSFLQMVSVTTSVITIALTISNYVIEKKGDFLWKNHNEMATRLALLPTVLAEIAFCGGIARFSFAFGVIELPDTNVGAIAFMMPLVLLSSVFSILPIIANKFRIKHSEFIFIAHKIIIWISIIGIFFFCGQDSWDAKASIKNVNMLKANNCLATFFITVTFTSASNITLGFFMMRRGTNFILYTWSEWIITKIAGLLDNIAWLFTETGLLITKISQALKESGEEEEVEEKEEEEEEEKKKEEFLLMDMTATAAKGKCKMNDASPSTATGSTNDNLDELEMSILPGRPELKEMSDGATNDENEIFDISNREIETIEATLPADASERSENRKKGKLDERKSAILRILFSEPFCPLFVFCLLLGALAGIFFSPVNYDRGFHVEFHSSCFKDRGFPLMSATENSKKGTICSYDLQTPSNAIVAARQLGLFSDPDSINKLCSKKTTIKYNTLLFGLLDYAGEENDDRKTPLLDPWCDGDEDNLMRCWSLGLGNVRSSCHENTRRLYIAVVPQKIKIGDWLKEEEKGPNFMYRIFNGTDANNWDGAYTFSQAKNEENCKEYYEGRITGAEDTAKIRDQLNAINVEKIWVSDGGNFDVESGKVIRPKNGTEEEKLPFVCKIALDGRSGSGWITRPPPIYEKPTCGRSAKIRRSTNPNSTDSPSIPGGANF